MAPSGLTLTWVGDRRRRARAPPPSDSAGTAVLTDLLQANAALSAPSANSAFCGIFVLICVLLLVSCVCSHCVLSSVCVRRMSELWVSSVSKNTCNVI